MLRSCLSTLKRSFSAGKEEFSRIYVMKLFFGEDGYYESDHLKPDFIDMVESMEKSSQGFILGGESFPFGISTFYINCDEPSFAQKLANENVFVKEGLAESSLQEVERISSTNFSTLANFYQTKMNK